MAIVRLTTNGMITIPRKIRDKYRIKPKDQISILDSPEGIIIIPIKPIESLKTEKEIANAICNELIFEHRQEQKE